MKRVFALILAALMLLALCACGKDTSETDSQQAEKTQTTEVAQIDQELMDKIVAMTDKELIQYAKQLEIDPSTYTIREDLEQAVYDAAIAAGGVENVSSKQSDNKQSDNNKTDKNNSSASSNSSKQSGGNTSPVKDDSFSVTAAFTEKKVDLGGKTIKIASLWNEWVASAGCPPKQSAAAAALTKIEKDYNCKITCVNVNPSTMLNDFVTNYAAGKVYADIIETQGSVASYAPYLKEVSSVQSLNLSKNGWNQFIGETACYKGKQYGVGFMMTQNLAISQEVIYFNKEVLKKYGGNENLYQLVRNKKWTWDKFLSLSKTVNQKSGGKVSGLVTQITSTITDMLLTNNVNFLKKSGDKYAFNVTNDNLLRGLQFWSDYDKAGYIYEVSGTEDWGASESAAFRNGKTLFMMGDYILASTYLNAYTNQYGVLPLPMGPNEKEYTTVAGTKYFCIAETPNAEAAGSVLVAMANRTGWDMKEWDEIQLESALPDEDSLEMMHLIFDSKTTHPQIIAEGMNYDHFKGKAMEVIYEQSATPAEALQSMESLQNSALVEYYK